MIRSTPNWLHLSDDEVVVWERRPHPIELGVGALVGVLIALAGAALAAWSATGDVSLPAPVGVGVGLVGLAVALARYVVWTSTRYVITSSELYKKRGIVSREVTQFRLDRIQNTSLEQGVAGRLLGYGDLTVYTAGTDGPELVFERMPQPEEAAGLLSEQFEQSAQPAV